MDHLLNLFEDLVQRSMKNNIRQGAATWLLPLLVIVVDTSVGTFFLSQLNPISYTFKNASCFQPSCHSKKEFSLSELLSFSSLLFPHISFPHKAKARAKFTGNSTKPMTKRRILTSFLQSWSNMPLKIIENFFNRSSPK